MRRRTPMALESFNALIKVLGQEGAPLADWQCAALVALSFSAMLRFDKLQGLNRVDVVF